MDRHRSEVESSAIAGSGPSGGDRPARIARAIAGGKPAKKQGRDWNPPYLGELDMRIASDGTWYYEGSAITRQPMVELFARVLRREDDGEYYLVTPVEKFRIRVDDAPFIAVAMDVEGEGRARDITFHTNVGDAAVAGPEHRLEFETSSPDDGLKPYVAIRDGLDALVARALVYDLVELAEEREVDGETRLGVWSGGRFFEMAGAAALGEQ